MHVPLFHVYSICSNVQEDLHTENVFMNRFTPVDEKEFEHDNEDDIDTEKLIGETSTRV